MHPFPQLTAGDLRKDTVVDFLDTVFNQHDVDGAIARCMGDTYRQHNPDVPDGVEGFRGFFHTFLAQHPNSGLVVHRVLREGDYVTVHLRWWTDAGAPGNAVMDIFRLDSGRIVEHWDVVQPIPATAANPNTMF